MGWSTKPNFIANNHFDTFISICNRFRLKCKLLCLVGLNDPFVQRELNSVWRTHEIPKNDELLIDSVAVRQ